MSAFALHHHHPHTNVACPTSRAVGYAGGNKSRKLYQEGLEGGAVMHYVDFVSINVNKGSPRLIPFIMGSEHVLFRIPPFMVNLVCCNYLQVEDTVLAIKKKKRFLFNEVGQPVYY